MKDLLPCLLRVLNLASVKPKQAGNSSSSSNGKGPDSKIQLPSGGSNWKKLKVPVKSYLEDVLSVLQTFFLHSFNKKTQTKIVFFFFFFTQFTSNINDPDILNAILRHVRVLVNFYMCFPKLLKSLIKTLITIWSQGDEKSRVIAFICIHKIVSNTHEKNQDLVYKVDHLFSFFFSIESFLKKVSNFSIHFQASLLVICPKRQIHVHKHTALDQFHAKIAD